MDLSRRLVFTSTLDPMELQSHAPPVEQKKSSATPLSLRVDSAR